MQLMPATFWRLTLAEWRAMLDGHAERINAGMRRSAWVVSHLLIAAGCDADKVTVAKLLGEKEPRTRKSKVDDEAKRIADFEKMWARMEKAAK